MNINKINFLYECAKMDDKFSAVIMNYNFNNYRREFLNWHGNLLQQIFTKNDTIKVN